MNRYHVCYKSKINGDCCTVWTEARSKEEAAEIIQHEYWDVEYIIEIY